MKMTQLLTGAAAIALVAGAANAQTAVTPSGAAGAPQQVANEYSGAFDGVATLTFGTLAAPFAGAAANAAISVDVTFTNATFSAPVAAAGLATTNTCAVSNVARNGGAGQSTVGWDFTDANVSNCDLTVDGAAIGVDIVRTTAGTPVTMTTSFTCSANCGAFVDFTETTQITWGADAYPAAGRSAAAAATVVLPSDGIGAAVAQNLGTVTYSFQDTIAAAGGAPGGNINTDAGSQIVNGNAVASGTVRVSFPSGITGVTSVAVAGAGACVADAVNNRFDCPVSAAQLIGLAGAGIQFTPDATNAIQPQTPTVEVLVSSNANYNVPGLAAVDLATIEWDDGLNTDSFADNTFEWVSVRSSGGTNNAFRLTGLGTDMTAPGACVQVRATRSNTTIANADWQCITGASVVASADSTWTATFGSADLNAALGAGEGNADIELRVRRSDAAGADDAFALQIQARRVLSRNGIVTGTGFDGDPTN